LGPRQCRLRLRYQGSLFSFVYMHEPGWYMRLDEAQRDVIDKSLDDGFLDLNGWDIRKAVKMLREGNCSILSWLQANIYYFKNDAFISEARALGQKYLSWKSVAFHFVNKAKKHLKEYFEGTRWKDEVIHKKYFFVIHPLLSVEWMIISEKKEIPPNLIDSLLASVRLEGPVSDSISKLISRKRAGEMPTTPNPRIEILDTWIAQSLQKCENYAKGLPILKHPPSDEFNDLIAKYVLDPNIK